jgi:hypothetical protein
MFSYIIQYIQVYHIQYIQVYHPIAHDNYRTIYTVPGRPGGYLEVASGSAAFSSDTTLMANVKGSYDTLHLPDMYHT